MEFRSVPSSNILGVAYDEDEQSMIVEFKSGAKYRYRGVPKSEYEGLLEAGSPGSYLHDNIKGQYPHTKV